MAKFYGVIGYAEQQVETAPGVWEDQITERSYAGDLVRNANRWSASSDSTNDNLNINNQISIISDPYAKQNFHQMKYVEFMGAKWRITSVDVQYPRLILTIGGVYNGQ